MESIERMSRRPLGRARAVALLLLAPAGAVIGAFYGGLLTGTGSGGLIDSGGQALTGVLFGLAYGVGVGLVGASVGSLPAAFLPASSRAAASIGAGVGVGIAWTVLFVGTVFKAGYAVDALPVDLVGCLVAAASMVMAAAFVWTLTHNCAAR
ncbi:MAG: hypothetical protein H7146_01695 [Burkholderiaceae bacterium]|nr:hypothetical protein [Microbacteriaceae bacterium]